jgi:DMSO/TMAO reductase YedYZ molybdopterin-dependent catalytic subunit
MFDPHDSTSSRSEDREALLRMLRRRQFIKRAAVGSAICALGGYYVFAGNDERAKEHRADGRLRLPPHQRVISSLKPMGGDEGDPDPREFKFKIHGEVDHPMEIDFKQLTAMPEVEQTCDVHCVTGWTLFDSIWTGVAISHLAEIAKVRSNAHYVIFESAHGYTANVRLADAMKPNCLVAYKYQHAAISEDHGAPVRALMPDFYFYKSAKWLTGLRFVSRDEPGFWERRGYHNHADPWREERYA